MIGAGIWDRGTARGDHGRLLRQVETGSKCIGRETNEVVIKKDGQSEEL